MTRWRQVVAGAVLIAQTSCTTAPEAAAMRPNLVVILADDAGVECFGCYGGESYATPNIDRLAREGVRFTNGFTQPLCTPTRVELLTGRSNARNYVAFSVLDPEERTFAEVLRDAGYRTYVTGKWQLLGAEHYPDGVRGRGSTPTQAGFDGHTLWQVERLGRRHWQPTLTADGVTRTLAEDRYGPDVALQAAIEWIDSGDDEPFLLFWPMILPHAPFIAPPGHEGPRERPGDAAMFGPTVEHLDAQVGRLVTHLETRGLGRDTVVLFLGDNGSPRGVTSRRDGRDVVGGKGRPTDAGSRVPFVLWAPGRVDGGSEVHDLVATVDVFPTLLDLAGVSIPDDRPLDGHSFAAAARGEPAVPRTTLAFHHHPRPVTRPKSKAVRWARDERWQLFADGRLYELAVDPELEHPIEHARATPEASAARARLAAALRALPEP